MNKKGELFIIGSLVVIVILLIIVLGVERSGRECNGNDDCKNNQYCGSDFKCHNHPVIEKNVVRYDFTWAGIVVALSILAAAFIINGKWSLKLINRSNHPNHNSDSHGNTHPEFEPPHENPEHELH